jgi:ankyrin repeat protein
MFWYSNAVVGVLQNSQAAFTEKAIKAMAQKCGGKLDYNVKDFEGRSPLMLAALYNNAWMVKNLLEVEKVNMNDTTDQGETAMMLTCGAANIDCLKVCPHRAA